MLCVVAATIDLHMHTTYSDGTEDPEALLEAVAKQGVKTLAVTDHDTTEAYERLHPKALELGLDLIQSIEINTHWKGAEVHVLGYFINFEDSDLQALTLQHRQQRQVQIKAMVEKIRKITNIPIHFDEVLAQSRPNGSIGRPHVARALMEKKAVRTLSEAFDKYLTSKCGTYVDRPTASPHEAVEAIYGSGGIPVIAHPGLSEAIEKLVPELLVYGLQGLEAYHKSHSPGVIQFICSLAEQHDLIVTGGTDFHGVAERYGMANHRLLMPGYIDKRLKQRNEALKRPQTALSGLTVKAVKVKSAS
jgi:3',5'-nucleoside bisphosphate phosphatase